MLSGSRLVVGGELLFGKPLRGLVPEGVKGELPAQVELVCGPYRVVSLMSAEAATELGLEPGVTAIASIKSTSVVIECSSRRILA